MRARLRVLLRAVTHERLGLGAGTALRDADRRELRAPELLRATFERAFLEAIAFGSRHHQPLEASLGLARRWLEVCAGRRPGRGPDGPREVVVHEEP